MEAVPEGIQIRSLAHQLVFPISPIHIAQSLMFAAAAAVTENIANGWLPLPAGLSAVAVVLLPVLVLVWLDGWLVALTPSYHPRASAVRRWSNAIMSRPRRKTASYFQERHELPPSH